MHKIKTVIVDDESLSRGNLQSMLGVHCPQIEVAGRAGSPATAKQLIHRIQPDLVFLDMNMPRGEGFSLLEHIPERSFRVIIVSSHSEHAIRAVKVRADDYIPKPLNAGDLESAVSNIQQLMKRRQKKNAHHTENAFPDKIIITHQKGFTVLDLKEITRLEGESNYSKIFLCGQPRLLSSKTLKDFEDILSSKFVRVHKSHIINLDHLKEYESTNGAYAVMKDSTRIMISRRRLPRFLKKVGLK